MRSVVTGGAGFIGSHLIEALVARGDDVVCVERPGASKRWLEDLPVVIRDHGLEDPERLIATLDGADVVYHLAGLTEARRPADYYRVNTEGTARVLRAAASLDGRAPRVVLASSLAAIGPCLDESAVSLESVPHPLSHYGQSKLLAEVMMHAYADRVPWVILRPTSVYGPREKGVLKFFQLVQHGIALTIGAWNREVCLLYVGDLVQGLLAAGTNPDAIGHTYYLAHPKPFTWREFAGVVGRALGRDPVLVSVPRSIAKVVALGAEFGAFLARTATVLNRDRVREITQARWVCDVGRSIAQLGFQPAYPIERGVPLTAAWYREARWI
jgi:nucleoside-diphosphate-sugar epimerase